MRSRRHRAIYWAYTGQKKKHRVARSTDELKTRFYWRKSFVMMATKAVQDLADAILNYRTTMKNFKDLKRS